MQLINLEKNLFLNYKNYISIIMQYIIIGYDLLLIESQQTGILMYIIKIYIVYIYIYIISII